MGGIGGGSWYGSVSICSIEGCGQGGVRCQGFQIELKSVRSDADRNGGDGADGPLLFSMNSILRPCLGIASVVVAVVLWVLPLAIVAVVFRLATGWIRIVDPQAFGSWELAGAASVKAGRSSLDTDGPAGHLGCEAIGRLG